MPENRGMRTKRDFQLSFFRSQSSAVKRALPFLLILLLLSLPSIAAAYKERIILSAQEGKCTFRMEADDEERSVRLRILPEDPDCYFSKEAMQSVLSRAFSKADPPKLEGTYLSLFLGRLIDYPWLSAHLASAAAGDHLWNRERGKPVSMDINRYVALLLSSKHVTAQFEEPLLNRGYRIASVSVEKVLVGGFRDIPQYKGKAVSGKFPFDAMVWFRIEKK
jgi:hypothetical protein